ncbi:Crp/Fnr family transcriptional regulator [Devosia sp.]|uniref:Crp/Fnr family transcriptional regulator n=1 Tax=Devosia sp. TaxID=1871048 RepID=UPI003BA9C4E9
MKGYALSANRHGKVRKQSSPSGIGNELGDCVASRKWGKMDRPFIDFALLARATTETRSFKAGETIFKAGEPGHEFFVVKSGTVAVQLRNRTLQVIGEGGIFGEMALIDSEPRSATVIAETDCVLVPVGEKQFLFMSSEAPYFALSLMRVLVQRLRAANESMPGA